MYIHIENTLLCEFVGQTNLGTFWNENAYSRKERETGDRRPGLRWLLCWQWGHGYIVARWKEETRKLDLSEVKLWVYWGEFNPSADVFIKFRPFPMSFVVAAAQPSYHRPIKVIPFKTIPRNPLTVSSYSGR